MIEKLVVGSQKSVFSRQELGIKNNYFTFWLITILSVLCFAFAEGPADWPDPFEMEFETLTPETLTPQRTELDNGLVVYLLEDHSLPIVDGAIYVRAPSIYDPEDKIGLADLTASLLREGGAGGKSTEEIDEALEFLAASVESSANPNYSSVSFSSLVENVEEVLPIFVDVLVHPDFDEERLELERGKALEGIRRQNDNPVDIAVREFFYYVVEGHPSGWYATEETINSITRDDLVEFHKNYFVPNEAYIAISGDFDSEKMLTLLEEAFADCWEPKEVEVPEIPEFNNNPEPKIYFAPKEVAQSTILIGHPTSIAYSPKYNDLTVANGILGGEGFSSRLTTEVRTQRGLAYSVGSALSQGFDYPGIFYAYSISRGDVTGEVLEALLSEIELLQTEGITEEELIQQKNTILNRAVFRFTSANAIVTRAARTDLLGLEPGYYDKYIERVQELSIEDVQTAAKSQLSLEEAVILVVGNPEIFDKPLEEFGEIITIELD